MNANKNITANFAINTYTLTVSATNGTVALNPPTGPYNYGTSVTLTPNAAEGYHVYSWSGDVPSGHETDNPLSVTMNANKNITANFTINTYTLTVSATNGTVALNPPTGPYNYGKSVTLTPSAAEGYTFKGWSGDVPSGHETDNPLSVTMNANKNITANFAINTYTLTVKCNEWDSGIESTDGTVQLRYVSDSDAECGRGLYVYRLEWRCPKRTRDGQSVIGDDECQ